MGLGKFLDENLGQALTGGRVLTSDEVAIDDNVGLPSRTTMDFSAAGAKAVFQQPGRISVQASRMLLRVGELGHVAALEQPTPCSSPAAMKLAGPWHREATVLV
jgi:hypothetical protein